MSRRMRNVEMTDELLDYLATLFDEHKILDKFGLSFGIFIEEWKKGKIEQYI